MSKSNNQIFPDVTESVSERTAYSAAFLFLCVFFVFACARYAVKLNLWGDEAFFMCLAGKSNAEIFSTITNHTPAYPLFLKTLIVFTGAGHVNEYAIRLIHALIFAGGFYFGFKTLRLFFGNSLPALLAVFFFMLVPSSVFYATNIKMYALLLCFTMWFIYEAVKFLGKNTEFSFRTAAPILTAGFFMLLSDYIGLLYYFVVSGIILFRNKAKNANKKDAILLLVPLLLLAVSMGPTIITSLKIMVMWPFVTKNVPKHAEHVALALFKIIFNSTRPFTELSDMSYKNILFPLVQLLEYVIFLVLGIFGAVKNNSTRKDPRFFLALSIALLWAITIVTGSSITRIFLPSQLFMSAFIIYAVFSLFSAGTARTAVFITLISFNFFLAVLPVYKFYSILPYHRVALEALAWAGMLKTDNILVSENSFGELSVNHYILSEKTDKNIRSTGLAPGWRKSDVPNGRFLFVNFMKENGCFIDPDTITAVTGRKLSVLARYTALDSLPYNSFWKKELLRRGGQDYAFILYFADQ